MAPPHMTKTNVTTSHTTSRRVNRDSRKNIAAQVDDENVDESEDVDVMDFDAASVAEPEASQQGSDGKLQQLMVNMVDAQRKRHQMREQGVHKSYAKAHTDMREAITTLFETHEAQASQAYDAQVKRLQELIKHKALIEAAMRKKLEGLRKAYMAQSNALQKVVEYRVKELR